MNVPFTAMHFSVYEAAKKWLLHVDSGDEEAEDRLSVQLVAGAAADIVIMSVRSSQVSCSCSTPYVAY
jgi:hypothetical protein